MKLGQAAVATDELELAALQPGGGDQEVSSGDTNEFTDQPPQLFVEAVLQKFCAQQQIEGTVLKR